MRGSSATAFRLRARDAVLDEGVSGADQLLHGLGDFAGREAGLEFEGGFMRASMRASQRSVLASLPVALSEASGPTGIDLDQGQAGLGERPFEQAMIGYRWLRRRSG